MFDSVGNPRPYREFSALYPRGQLSQRTGGGMGKRKRALLRAKPCSRKEWEYSRGDVWQSDPHLGLGRCSSWARNANPGNVSAVLWILRITWSGPSPLLAGP